MNLKRRWDIYWNGADGAKETTRNMLTMWAHLFPACGIFAEALVEFLGSLLRVLLVLVAPLLFWTAPVISIFTAHRTLSDEEVRQLWRERGYTHGDQP
jgi:hypothetical protein